MIENIFIELGIIVLIAVGVSAVMRMLKQPLIIGYILTGIIAGPYLLNIGVSSASIQMFSHLGIAFLLFIAGLSLSPNLIKSVGKVSVFTGILQMLSTFIPGFLLSMYFGFTFIESMYIALALAFSSTIIIVKLLSDKDKLETLYGRIILGILVVQDIAAIVALMVISSFAGGIYSLNITVNTLLKGVGMLTLVIIFSLLVLPKLHEKIAKSQEFLLLFSIGWLLLISAIFSYLQFSVEIGALIAGITLAGSPYSYEIKAKMKSLRDFFILFFFVLLGSQMVFSSLEAYLVPILIFSAVVIVGTPLIVISVMGAMRYTKRNSFLTGISIAQISEFSFILVALGVSVGHLDNAILSMVTAIGLVTFLVSTYLIEHADTIYHIFSEHLKFFERKGPWAEGEHLEHPNHDHEIIMFGCNRTGYALLDAIKKLKKKFLIIDHNPEIISDLFEKGYHCKYGDANDLELLSSIEFENADMVISTIPDLETNLLIINQAKEENEDIIIITVAHQIDEALQLHDDGATYVLMPYFLGAEYASTLIERDGINLKKFMKEKAKQMENLQKRKEMKHRHPKREKER
ncbi:MAG: cation:proton antiporter [Candidatus Undinarchaeales archaeon]